MRRFAAYGPSIVVLAAAALALIAGPRAFHNFQAAHTAVVVKVAQQELDADTILERLNQATRRIAEAVEPSVVYIESTGPAVELQRGSGWVYDGSGHVVTNSHVVRGAAKITVQLFDGRVREAEFVGADPSTDIAVLRVGADQFSPLPMRRATGEAVFLGDMVYAFGSPFGFKFSMSEGIVSGLGRDTSSGGLYTNYIQTDAAINPGNSGGPLVDIRGRVIGMNTAIITDTENMEGRQNVGVSGGLGFAIPLETIESVVAQIVSKRVVLKGYLGVSLDQLNVEEAERNGFRGAGVLVQTVQEGLPAERAGLRAFDVITAVNGSLTPSLPVLRSLIGNREPGEEITLTVWRKGQSGAPGEAMDIKTRLAAARTEPEFNRRGRVVGYTLTVVEPSGDVSRFESLVESVERSLGAFGIRGVENNPMGLRITDVAEGSTADRAGFREGQIIVTVADRPTQDQAAFYDVLGQARMAASTEPIRVRVHDPARGMAELPHTFGG